jgi:hypothetical protein
MNDAEFYDLFSQDEDYVKGVIDGIRADAEVIFENGGSFQDVYQLVLDDITAAPFQNVRDYFAIMVTATVMDLIVGAEDVPDEV